MYMYKVIGFGLLALLAGCVSAEDQMVWDQAVARLPPGAATECEMHSQQVSANYYNPRALLGLEEAAVANKARNTCLKMQIERNGGFQSAAPKGMSPQAEAFLQPYFVQYGREPIMQCGYSAERAGGGDQQKLSTFMACVSHLQRL